MSLKEPNNKMSKSAADPKSRILLTDSAATIQKKVKVALTDSEPVITYDPENRPGVSNLIEMLSHFENVSCQEIAAEYSGASLRSLKEHVGSRIAESLEGVRERYLEIIDERGGFLDDVAEEGGRVARDSADKTMWKVKRAMGLA